MKIKTSDLTLLALNNAVHELVYPDEPIKEGCTAPPYSSDWSFGGPIIEREKISVEYNRAEFTWLWTAYKLGDPHEENPKGGPTPLIAAMRCYVASVLGDEVEIPKELL